MEEPFFYHALRIDKDDCIACSHCMRSCPTEAIRIVNGKANLYTERCIDCGNCYSVCPVNAIDVVQDDFNDIFNYDYRVALITAVFIAQFEGSLSRKIEPEELYAALLELGFTHVFEIEHVVDYYSDELLKYMRINADVSPLISAFCPAVVRLIQVKFPSLTRNLVLMKQPSEVAAMYYRKELVKKGAAENEIGMFYVTQCAAKIASIKTPVGEDRSEIRGVINMDFLYNKVLKILKNKPKYTDMDLENQSKHRTQVSSKGLLWTLTDGESNCMFGRSLAIDGIEHVNAYLEKIEDLEEIDIDFLELKACDRGCAGGILVRNLRFLVVEEIKRRAIDFAISKYSRTKDLGLDKHILEEITKRIKTNKVLPRSMMKLDNDLSVAMKKMERIRETLQILPKKDCGVCGAPSCAAFAEDIAHERAELKNCVFLQTYLEEKGNMSVSERVEIFKKIWGEEIFNTRKKDHQ